MGGAALALLLAWQRRPRLALPVLLAALLSASELAPLLERAEPPSTAAAGAAKLRVASLNVLSLNDDYDRVLEWLQRERPAVVVLIETTPGWRRALAGLRGLYPVQHFAHASQRRSDVLLLARVPVLDVRTLEITPRSTLAVLATLGISGHTVHVLGVHLTWPLGPEVSRLRAQELRWIARLARETDGPCVVAGDLNLTPFSPAFGQLLREGRLASAATGRGWQPTWPTFLPPAGLQIDHLLLRGPVEALDFRRGPRIGSDHLPIVADLALPGG